MDLMKINEARAAKGLAPLTDEQAGKVMMQVANAPRSRAADIEQTTDEEILTNVVVGPE